MPKYEYACGQCGAESEMEQRMADDPIIICPKCGEEGLERLISRSSFALKGGGWYADGYGDQGPPKKKEDQASTPDKEDSGKESTEPSANGDNEKPSTEVKPSETKSTETKPSPAKKETSSAGASQE